ncbi:hypothetical protein RND71_014430 [Anisodus tanguticus]|uniref:Uncharacterized protein n=1 Tax=Anisodus tanguticus TaxID=243964 RepID=A0AAE1VNM8_9SOLA|nr:hypothetical protein RND71_014430 [Anisodus tanguticus]
MLNWMTIKIQPTINDLMDDMFKEGDDPGIATSIHVPMGDVEINKENLSGDTLRASTEEIQEGCDLSEKLIESEESILANEQVDVNQQDLVTVDAVILIETFQNTSLDSGILSYEGTHVPVDEKSDSAPSDANLSSVLVGAVVVSDEVAEFDDLHTSQELVTYSQFKFPNKLLPSQVPPTRIVMTLRRERRPSLKKFGSTSTANCSSLSSGGGVVTGVGIDSNTIVTGGLLLLIVH